MRTSLAQAVSYIHVELNLQRNVIEGDAETQAISTRQSCSQGSNRFAGQRQTAVLTCTEDHSLFPSVQRQHDAPTVVAAEPRHVVHRLTNQQPRQLLLINAQANCLPLHLDFHDAMDSRSAGLLQLRSSLRSLSASGSSIAPRRS